MEDVLEIATVIVPTAALAKKGARAEGRARMAGAWASETGGGVILNIAAGTQRHPKQDTVSRREAGNSSHGRFRHPPNTVGK